MRINETFKALADPIRREILHLLRSEGELTAGQLAERFSVTKPTLSHHFAVLKAADLVRTRKQGQQVIYALDTTVIQDVITLFVGLFAKPETAENPAKSQTNPQTGEPT